MKKKLEFMSIAMKHYPEVKTLMEKNGLDIRRNQIQPFMELFTTIMNEAYEMGYKDGAKLR